MKKHITGDITIPNLNITIELCDEDRKRLDDILEALKGKTGHCNCAEHATEAPESAKETPQQPQPKEVPTEPEKAENEPKQEAPEVSVAELQSKVVQLVSAGKKEATRAIVMEYAKSVGEIPADKRAEVLERLNALEG